MYEMNTSGNKRYASVGVAAFVAIFQVTFYRAANRGELYTNLVLASGFEIDFKQVVAFAAGKQPVRQCGALGTVGGRQAVIRLVVAFNTRYIAF